MDEKLIGLFVKRDVLTGRRKVTLFGWLSLAILAMLLLAILLAALRFARGGLKPVRNIPLPTPTGQPIASPGKSGQPVGKSETSCPTSWRVWKVKDPLTGYEIYDAPPEVKACVKAQYLEMYRALGPKTIEEFDPQRAVQLGLLLSPNSLSEITAIQFEKRVIAVVGFSPDGLHCKVADYTEGARARVYSWPEKKLLREETYPDRVVVYPMEYHADTGRWIITPRPGQPTALTTYELPDGIPELVIGLYGTVED